MGVERTNAAPAEPSGIALETQHPVGILRSSSSSRNVERQGSSIRRGLVWDEANLADNERYSSFSPYHACLAHARRRMVSPVMHQDQG